MGLSIEEQETHINFMRGDDRATIYTSDTTMMTKFNKLVEIAGAEWKLEKVERLNGSIIGCTYSCPVPFISYRSKRIKRELTAEQRQEIANRFRKSIGVNKLEGEHTAEDKNITEEVLM